MRFTITFHGPFRVAAGASSDGLDETYDAANPLPSSSLKGLMRAHAEQVLKVSEPRVAEVFGSGRVPSPWWWSDAVIAASPAAPAGGGPHRIRTRVRIDPDTFTAAGKAMQTAGELWPASAEFEVRRRGPVPAGRIAVHEAILAASSRAITALGSDRRRGLGWVSVVPDLPWDDAQLHFVLSSRGNDA
jgi:CRISPR/Cas system CSM-associated protein Csm3 (group 7 of RAMP superfamily)